VKFLCEQCKAKYQISDDKVVGKTVRMKCRKCGHMIEVRAEVTETSVASDRPAAAPSAGQLPSPPRPVAKPAPPRSTSLAASLTSPRPLAPRPGALAGAFKSTVQHEEEVSAPFDMAEISPNDDWYVAINGVPVGPIRIAEVRRKAVLGAVTEDSLVWQEGLDEWRPLRSFPDLAAIVRGALAGTRTSMTPPPPEARGSIPPPNRLSTRPAQSLAPQRPPPPRGGAFAAAPAARSNVVAISSRLATAERLVDPAPFARPSALSQQASAGFGTDGTAAASIPASVVPAPPKKEIPWMPIMMLVMGVGFSVTLAITLTPKISELLHPSPTTAPSASVAVLPSPPPVATATPQPTAEPTANVTTPSTPTKSAPAGALARAAPSATSTGRSLNLSGLGSNGVALADDPSSDGPKAPGQCLSEGQVQKVVQLHMVPVRRTCWERSQSNKPSVNVNVTLTVGADGSAQNVSASGDDPTVAKCIENDVRGWRFPAMGCTQRTAIPFKFLLQ
jgi:predicted Zn finger-like uncharacterized protein